MASWLETLPANDRSFLTHWAPHVGKRGAIPDAWQAVHGGRRRWATVKGARRLDQLGRECNRWVNAGYDEPLDQLDKSWLLEQLRDIQAMPRITDRNLADALSMIQKLAPTDVRTYPDWRVDYLKPVQWEVFSDATRFRVVVAGRRSGKTHEAVTELITEASETPGAVCYYLARTRTNVKKVAWRLFKQLVNWEYVEKSNENELWVEFFNGSYIQFDGVEKPDNLRGPGLNFVVCEEFASWTNGRKIWDEVIRPMLSDRKGRGLFIGTPAGYNHFRDFYLRGQDPEQSEWSSYRFSTLEAGIVDADEVEAAKQDNDPRSFRQEYDASFEQLANRIYDFFERAANVTEDVEDQGGELLVGIDFNLDPMTCVIAQNVKGECEVLESHELPYSNTEELCIEVENRWPGRKFRAFPDPSGRRRQTSAGGKTDFSIIESREAWTLDPSMKRPWSIPLADKINNVQANVRDAAGGVHVRIHPRATALINALEGTVYKDGTSIPDDKNPGIHITDAFGYLLWGGFNRFKKKLRQRHFAI